MVVEGCPGLQIDPQAVMWFRLFRLAYTPTLNGNRISYQRSIDFGTMMDLPNVLTEAFTAIQDELMQIQMETRT